MSRARHGLTFAVVAALCYALLRQESGHGDGPGMLLLLRQGLVWAAGNHFLYLPLLDVVARALAPLGVSTFVAAGLLSAAGTAIGVWFVHTACRRLQMSAEHAALVTGMTAFSPAIVFFATTVEMHGVFFAFVGAAIWRAAVAITDPRVRHGAWLGLATGVAFAAHATAHLLVPLFVAILWAEVRDRRTTARIGAMVVLCHVATVTISVTVVQALGSDVSVSGSVGFLELFATAAKEHLGRLPTKWLEEWFWPFLLPSIACLGGVGNAPRLAFVTLVSLGVYFAIAFALTANTNEHGAYLLPLAFPASWLVVRGFSRRMSRAIAAVTIVFAVGFVAHFDDATRMRAHADSIRAVSVGRTPFLLIATPIDYEVCAIELPQAEFYRVLDFAPHPPATVLAAFDDLVTTLRATRTLVLTNGAREMLELADDKGSPAARALLDHLDTNYRLVRIGSGWRIE